MSQRKYQHKYRIGQRVEFLNGTLPVAPGTYEVVRLLPSEGGEPQYRIKSEQEAYERVAREDQLGRLES